MVSCHGDLQGYNDAGDVESLQKGTWWKQEDPASGTLRRTRPFNMTVAGHVPDWHMLL